MAGECGERATSVVIFPTVVILGVERDLEVGDGVVQNKPRTPHGPVG
jgi:hypothetical protein